VKKHNVAPAAGGLQPCADPAEQLLRQSPAALVEAAWFPDAPLLCGAGMTLQATGLILSMDSAIGHIQYKDLRDWLASAARQLADPIADQADLMIVLLNGGWCMTSFYLFLASCGVSRFDTQQYSRFPAPRRASGCSQPLGSVVQLTAS
jgi:hypothetical protein